MFIARFSIPNNELESVTLPYLNSESTRRAIKGPLVRVPPGVCYFPLNKISTVSNTIVHSRKYVLLPVHVGISCVNLYKKVCKSLEPVSQNMNWNVSHFYSSAQWSRHSACNRRGLGSSPTKDVPVSTPLIFHCFKNNCSQSQMMLLPKHGWHFVRHMPKPVSQTMNGKVLRSRSSDIRVLGR